MGALKPHHRKPYRNRHIGLLVISGIALIVLVLQAGVLIGRGQSQPPPATTATTLASPSTLTVVRSNYGYSLSVDSNQFNVTATQLDDKGAPHQVVPSQLHDKLALVSTVLKPRRGTVARAESVAQLSIQVDPDGANLAKAEAKPESVGLPPAVVAGQLFPVTAISGMDVSVVSSQADTMGDAPVNKTVYKYTPKFAGGNSYAVVWTGVSQGHAFAVKLQGLVGAGAVPTTFATVFESMNFDSNQSVKAASTNVNRPKSSVDASNIDPKYLADDLSPAVVKIYHIVCGTLTISGDALTNDSCAGFSGSGFLATSNGYIATNGHVVVYIAQDALVDILTANPATLMAFLKGIGLNDSQISAASNDPVTMASIIAKIYDIPDSKLNFAGKKELTLVALGTSAPNFDQLATSADISRYQRQTQDVKVAKVIAFNYAAKDALTTISDPAKGFSSSDVALLKINTSNAPTIAISTNKVTQNQKVAIMGFPGDADNQLTDNRQLSVSITDGVISSIRQAAGGKGRLYQSDADASHGNSGGPAIGDDGTVLGLLTYRASGDTEGNAAKSYIRDITDFSDLATANNVAINSDSSTQQLWQQGLQLYARNHFSAALKDFNKVQAAYPAHRLVDDYISSSTEAIMAGKDVKQTPVALVVGGIVLALGVLLASLIFIIRHHTRHKLYLLYPPTNSAATPPVVH